MTALQRRVFIYICMLFMSFVVFLVVCFYMYELCGVVCTFICASGDEKRCMLKADIDIRRNERQYEV